MSVLVEGAFIGYGVTKLLNSVLKAVSLLVKSNKSFSALCNMLTDLKPVVADITKRTEPPQPWNQWLQRLHEQLQKAEVLVHKFTTQSKYDIVMRMKRSAELVGVTEEIRNLREGAGSAGLVSSLQNSEKLDKLILELRTNHQDLLFSGTTRNVVNLEVARPHYLSLNRTIPSSARQEIRDHADAMTIPKDLNRRSEHGATSSNTEQQRKARGISKSSEIIFGDDNFMEEVKKLRLSDEKSKWVGIWSMGGAGKTLTAQRVYNDPDIRNRFVGGTFWLTVGREQTPLSLLHLLYKKITGNQATEEDVKEQVESKLGDHVLLVLDDVWSMTVLDSLNVAHHAGSKILVTTRDQSLLERVSAEKLQLPMLSREHSWQLFCWHAFGGENNVSRSLERDFDACAREVADECKGLPLALKVIGSTMRGKSDPRLWKIDLQRLKHAYTLSEEHEKRLFHRLQLSIDDLGQFDKRLIDCFYYFAAFPEDCSVHLNDLLSLWMGEGMVRGSSALSPEDEAYLLLGHLIARSLIELDSLDSCSNSLVYKIHDVLRDLVRHNLQHNLKPDKRLCLYQPGMQLTRFPEDWKSSHLQTSTTSSSLSFPSVQRMSLMFNDLEELPSQRLIAPDLLVFLARENNRIESLPRQLFAGLSHLRVLDLSSTGIKEIPAAALRDLKHLMLLNLSRCKNLEKIPDSIKYLLNLKEFRLKRCEKLKAIPSGVRFLKNLQILDMDSSDAWDHKESEIRLLRLRPSWMSMGVAILHDVSHLTALTKLSVSSSSLTRLSINFNSLKLLRHLLVDFIELRSFQIQAVLRNWSP